MKNYLSVASHFVSRQYSAATRHRGDISIPCSVAGKRSPALWALLIYTVFALPSFAAGNPELQSTTAAETASSPERIDSLERTDSPEPNDSPERIDSPDRASNPNDFPNSYSIAPYNASYGITYKGISSVLKRSLKQNGSIWTLSNSLSLFLLGFSEQSTFSENKGRITAMRYTFKNGLSSKKDSDLYFNWKRSTVTDSKRNRSFVISANSIDTLSYQLQLRIELMRQGEAFTEMDYILVDRRRPKKYTIKRIGDELLTTSAGTFLATKLEQRRVGKDNYTVIWMARERDYFLLRLERIEDGDATYAIELQEANIAGRAIESDH